MTTRFEHIDGDCLNVIVKYMCPLDLLFFFAACKAARAAVIAHGRIAVRGSYSSKGGVRILRGDHARSHGTEARILCFDKVDSQHVALTTYKLQNATIIPQRMKAERKVLLQLVLTHDVASYIKRLDLIDALWDSPRAIVPRELMHGPDNPQQVSYVEECFEQLFRRSKRIVNDLVHSKEINVPPAYRGAFRVARMQENSCMADKRHTKVPVQSLRFHNLAAEQASLVKGMVGGGEE